MITEWKEADVETLNRLWTEGLSASEIATKMGHGLTRSAVIGKAHRLKLGSRKVEPHVGKRGRAGNPGGVSAHRVQKARSIAARPDKATHSSAGSFSLHFGNVPFRSGSVVDDHDDDGVDVSHLMRFTDRRIGKDCAYIPGDPRNGARCCGQPVVAGQQWCSEHLARVYPATD